MNKYTLEERLNKLESTSRLTEQKLLDLKKTIEDNCVAQAQEAQRAQSGGFDTHMIVPVEEFAPGFNKNIEERGDNDPGFMDSDYYGNSKKISVGPDGLSGVATFLDDVASEIVLSIERRAFALSAHQGGSTIYNRFRDFYLQERDSVEAHATIKADDALLYLYGLSYVFNTVKNPEMVLKYTWAQLGILQNYLNNFIYPLFTKIELTDPDVEFRDTEYSIKRDFYEIKALITLLEDLIKQSARIRAIEDNPFIPWD